MKLERETCPEARDVRSLCKMGFVPSFPNLENVSPFVFHWPSIYTSNGLLSITEYQQCNVIYAHDYFNHSKTLLQPALGSTTSLFILTLEQTLHQHQLARLSHRHIKHCETIFSRL